MSKLAALKKQIAALEAQAERIAREEMSSAIAKVKDIMAEFNLTIEHLTQTVAGKRAVKKTKAKAKTASAAKYVDPKTGKTWSGFGRALGLDCRSEKSRCLPRWQECGGRPRSQGTGRRKEGLRQGYEGSQGS